jgi:UDP-GlcNAc:undecaprenyl-phosphate/decaprenyl-phosphate GlcNAc-1-phosphate transferase
MALICTIVLTFLVSLVAVWLIRALARRKGWYDRVNERKIHTGTIPRLGGVGICVGFGIAFLTVILLPIGPFPHLAISNRFWPVAVSGIVLFALGLIDDFRSLRARFKFGIQIIAATFVVVMGYRFRTVDLPFFGIGSLDLGLFSYPLTVIWIVGVTNALNLIDGMDGLAGTVSSIVTITFAAYFYLTNDYASAVLCCILLGAVGGFLAFNRPKASIFMGDGGALFLGFVLAVLPLLNQTHGGREELGILSAITALLIPIYDTFAAMLRRYRAHVSFFEPDRGHLHHKLLDLGLSPWQVLAVVAIANLALGAAALSSLYLDGLGAFAMKIGSWILFLGLFLLLHYNKKKELGEAGK